MKLALFAGPSGGHLSPALAFRDAFRKKHPEAEFAIVVPSKVPVFLRRWLDESRDPVFYVPDFPLPPVLSLKAIPFLLKLAAGFLKTHAILRKTQPDVLVAFGTFVSFPGLVLGSWSHIPSLLHEQNVRFGRANKMLIRFATQVAVTFPSTLREVPGQKGVCVGNVLRPELVRAAAKGHRGGARLQILVLGGSQGSAFLNRLVLEGFRLMSAEEKRNLAVVHITGGADFLRVKEAYEGMDMASEIMPFSDEMPSLYAESDLVLGRSGSGTLAEIAVFGLPSILIPYPHAASHQGENARFLANGGAACVLEETEASPEKLREEILSMAGDKAKRETMRNKVRKFARWDAGERLVEEVERLMAPSHGGMKR